jgi:Rho GDP-dissociation inhibitor
MSDIHTKHEEEEELDSKYQPPKEVPLDQLLKQDSDDAALNKYKQALIGDAANVIIEPTDERKVLMKRIVLVFDDHEEMSSDLTDVAKIKDKVVTIKEGAVYRVKLEFYVQRDIVSGLKYVQTAYKGPIRSNLKYFSIEN